METDTKKIASGGKWGYIGSRQKDKTEIPDENSRVSGKRNPGEIRRAVPKGEVANTLEEATTWPASSLPRAPRAWSSRRRFTPEAAAKAAASRWRSTREDAELHAKNILGMQLVTHQTGPQGQKVQRLLIEETAAIDRELYLGIVLDRAAGKLVFMASQAGGMEIEEVAAKTPEAIFKETIDPAVGFGAWQARKLAFALGLKPTQINQAVAFFQSLYKAFVETDASLVEINPFITTKDDKLFALDAKINFDDNALFRHADIKALRDIAEEDPLEVEASNTRSTTSSSTAPSPAW